jgi:hypothetical protein
MAVWTLDAINRLLAEYPEMVDVVTKGIQSGKIVISELSTEETFEKNPERRPG